MKVIFEFDPSDDSKDDRNDLKIFQNSMEMYIALGDLTNIIRNLNKGYVYYDTENESEGEDPFSRIHVDKLIDDLNEVICDSKISDILY